MMFGKRKQSDEPTAPVVAELPAGHDDEQSQWFVPAELREDYQRVDVSLKAIHRAENALEGELILAEAAAAQEPIVKRWIEEATKAKDPQRANGLRRLFYGGGLSRIVHGAPGQTWAEEQPEHPFRPRHEPHLGRAFHIPRERPLSPAERALAAHRARVERAAEVVTQRKQQEAIIKATTCEVCGVQGGAGKRTIRVAGAEPLSVRCCDLCESSLTHEIRRRVAFQTMPNGKTRVQVAAAFIDRL